jgi:ubiquinone/menaquinone biosynthesis C-methylase UbiE
MFQMTDRQKNEKDFHNQWSKEIDVNRINVDAGFQSPTASENRTILGRFGDVKGANILDLGCGMGDTAVFFAKQGASVHGIDISDGMIEVAGRLAKKQGVADRLFCKQMPAESLGFEDCFFDYIYGNGVLHHVNLESTIREVYRVLKPGGQAAFIEPLTYNPLIWVYRMIAKAVRSENEHPLSLKDIRFITSGLAESNNRVTWAQASHVEFHLFTLFLMLWFFIGERISPSKVRYWKLFIEKGPEYSDIFYRLQAVDDWLFKNIPFLRRFSWNTVIFLKK